MKPIIKNRLMVFWFIILFIGQVLGQVQPKFNLTTAVSGADAYQIIVTTDADESDHIWISDQLNSFPVTYPSSAPALEYGMVYYARIIALKDGNIHGIPGNLVLIQTPTISKPLIMDGPLFSWGATDPPSATYEVSVSLVQDMSNIVWAAVVSGTNTEQPENVFNWGTTYYWQVQGFDGDDNPFGDPSESGFFQTESIEPPTLNSPVGEQVSSLTPTFSWSAVSQVSQYLISVGTDEELASPVWGTNITEVSATYPQDAMNLSRGVSYFWQIIPLDADGNTFGEEVKSPVASFQTPDPIQPPNLNSPVGEEIPGLVPSFSWSAVEGITKYLINLAEDEDISTIIWTTTVEGSNVDYPDNAISLNYATTYYWNVSPLNEEDLPYSDAQSISANFSTTSLAPIDLLEPVNTSIGSLLPVFKWAASENASNYRLVIGTSDDIVVSETVSGTEYSSFVGSYDMTYFWRVTPLDDNGTELANASDIVTFSTPGLNELSLTSPVSVTVSNITPVLKWGALEGAFGYLVAVSLDGNIIWSDLVDANEVTYPNEPSLNYASTYSWSVQAVDESVTPMSNKPESAFTTPAFTQVELGSPVGGEVGVVNIQFSWSEVEGAAGYLVEISPNDDMSSAWGSTVSMTNLTYPDDPPFQSGQSYYWRVIVVDQDGNLIGAWSDIGSFQIEQPPPLILGEPSGEISTTSPSFSWQEVEGASGYKVRVSSNEDFSDGWESTSGVTSVQYAGDALEFNVAYYWQAVVTDQNGNIIGLWSDVASFQLSTIFIVNLISPMNEEVFSQTPQFSWEAVEGVGKYEIIVSSSDDMSEIMWSIAELQDAGTQYPSAGAEPLVFGNTYYWYVRSLDGDGNPLADPSSIASFTLSGDLTPELLVPLDTQIENLTPVFSWSEVSGADKFFILVSSADDFSEIVYQNENIDGTGLTYPTSGAAPLEYETTYYWKIQALSADGSSLGDSSPTGLFMTPTGEIEIIVEFEN
jgi:hypothetical protein